MLWRPLDNAGSRTLSGQHHAHAKKEGGRQRQHPQESQKFAYWAERCQQSELLQATKRGPEHLRDVDAKISVQARENQGDSIGYRSSVASVLLRTKGNMVNFCWATIRGTLSLSFAVAPTGKSWETVKRIAKRAGWPTETPASTWGAVRGISELKCVRKEICNGPVALFHLSPKSLEMIRHA